VKLKSSVSFLSIEFEHVDCHSSACLTRNEKSKNLQNWKESITLNTYSNLIYIRTLFYVLKFDIRTLLNILKVRIL
jgi:hypothetical protein